MSRKSILTVLITVVATLVMSPVFAQLEEIIVTASKREQTLHLTISCCTLCNKLGAAPQN